MSIRSSARADTDTHFRARQCLLEWCSLSPDTRIDNWDGSSGYHYSDSKFSVFAHASERHGHSRLLRYFVYADIGEPQFFAKEGEKNENGYASKFSHANEKAEAGYYSVKLDDDNIFAEMTATKRVGFHRYTFPKSDEANIILDLKWRDKVLASEYKVVGTNRVEGYRRSSSWAKNQIVYFVAEFSKPFEFFISSPEPTDVPVGAFVKEPVFKGDN